MKESKVDSVVSFVAEYTAKVVKNGSLDTVCIPYFGKFEAKLKQAGYVDRMRGRTKLLFPPEITNQDNDTI